MTPMYMALLRSAWSVIAALIFAAGGSYLALASTPMLESDRIRISLITGLVAAVGPFVSRGVGEGAWDQGRANAGTMSDADVPIASRSVDVIDSTTGIPVPGQPTKP